MRALGWAQIGTGKSAGETRRTRTIIRGCARLFDGATFGLLRCRAEQGLQRFGAQRLTPPIRFSADDARGFPLESADLRALARRPFKRHGAADIANIGRDRAERTYVGHASRRTRRSPRPDLCDCQLQRLAAVPTAYTGCFLLYLRCTFL